MRPVRTLVLAGYGVNCEREMAAAAEMAGAEAVIVHTKRWLTGEIRLKDFDLLLFPGGFSFGDELGAGKVFANKIAFFPERTQEIQEFIAAKKCILGICNGFQLLVKLGILPGGTKAALARNAQARFEARWVHQRVVSDRCIFTRGMKELYLPVRHAEGNFVGSDAKAIDQLFQQGQVALQYATQEGEEALHFPDNPNGSTRAIAGICDPTGHVLGMMPHPEAALFFTHLPDWTRRKAELRRQGKPLPEHASGLQLFKNAVEYLRQL